MITHYFNLTDLHRSVRLGLLMLLLGSVSWQLFAQDTIQPYWSAATPAYQNNWIVTLRLPGINNLASMQFGLNWEMESISLSAYELGPSFGTELVVVEETESMLLSWLDTAGNGVNIDNEEVLLTLQFAVTECPEDSLQIRWDNIAPSPEFTVWSADTLYTGFLVLDNLTAVVQTAEIFLFVDTFFCAQTNLLLLADCIDCTSWEWSDGTTNNDLVIATPGDYTVTATTATGCSLMDTVSVDTFPLPQLTAFDTLACVGDTLLLSPYEADFDSYSWSTGATTPVISITEEGTYQLNVTDSSGCEGEAVYKVTFQDITPVVLFADPIKPCLHDTLSLAVDGPDSLWWSDNQVVGPDEFGDYTFVVQDTLVDLYVVGVDVCGQDTVFLTLHAVPARGFAMPDTCIQENTELRLSAFGGSKYEWLESEYSVTENFEPITTSRPLDSTFYYVQITDENGCTLVDSVYVAIANDPASFLRLINFISPNGDGENDELYFDDLEKYGDNRLLIVNRWNQIIYEKRNYQSDEERFRGHKNGKPLADGEYFYQLEIGGTVLTQTLILLRNEQG